MAKSVVFNGELYGTVDYTVLENKPQIGGVTLSGNKTLGDLGAIPAAEKGANNGVATLDGSGKVPSSQLPAYVDDVVEYANLAAFPTTGVASILYVALDTNALYRWSGSTYVSVTSGSGSLALGETASTAYRGDRGKTAYDHSQITTGNPHGVTKANVGLGNVDNTSDANKPISTATATALSGKQDTLNRTVIGDDNGTAAVTDTGGNLSIAMPVTTVAPSASTTQTTAGTRSIRAQIKILVDNIAALLGYFTSGKLKTANGGTGLSAVAAYTPTQRRVFASSRLTTPKAPEFAALEPSDIGLTATATELDYVAGVTSAIQTQLNAKANTSSLGSLATKSTIVSADITDGTIVNADISSSAAIATSKVDFTTAQNNALNSGVTSTVVGKVNNAIVNDGAASKVVKIAVVASLPSTPATDTLYLVG